MKFSYKKFVFFYMRLKYVSSWIKRNVWSCYLYTRIYMYNVCLFYESYNGYFYGT